MCRFRQILITSQNWLLLKQLRFILFQEASISFSNHQMLFHIQKSAVLLDERKRLSSWEGAHSEGSRTTCPGFENECPESLVRVIIFGSSPIIGFLPDSELLLFRTIAPGDGLGMLLTTFLKPDWPVVPVSNYSPCARRVPCREAPPCKSRLKSPQPTKCKDALLEGFFGRRNAHSCVEITFFQSRTAWSWGYAGHPISAHHIPINL